MSKVPRNSRCPCGSGLKFKHCCGSLVSSPEAVGSGQYHWSVTGSTNRPGLAPSALTEIDAILRRHEAGERQRRLMQGLGEPIVSANFEGHRLVAVGKKLYWSKNWLTFQDFLMDFIKIILGPDWGTKELQRPPALRHPLMRWYGMLCDFQEAHASTRGDGPIYTSTMSGAVKAYLDLAYDLYLIAHNAELPKQLLDSLRNADQFEGAVYEAHVVGIFAKSGFSIDMEDQRDPSKSHCEFVATHKETGKNFSVEAKATTSRSSRSGASLEPPRLKTKLAEALRKDVAHKRIVFIELGRAAEPLQAGLPRWLPKLDDELAEAERSLKVRGAPAPPAYLFVTNRPFLWALDAPAEMESALIYGFKIPDFMPRGGWGSILAAVKARRRHIELHWLSKAYQSHARIPSTFDERLPEELLLPDEVTRLQIGGRYLVPIEDGTEVPSVLEDAIVMEEWGAIVGVYRLEDGRQILCRGPISKHELDVYRASPSTFFGQVKHVPSGIKSPLDAFDFCYETYSKSTKEKLLGFMADWPNAEELRALSQPELADLYCDRMAAAMWAQAGAAKDAA